ncbi:MAG: arginine--tRNA ligase [Candidatus Zambryskibacteria bacterium RIFCSPHIGHO2_01_FULL_43_25]|uniref:Arginine--tRNA ligase n=1 Tax=Candidatus Zambryskibacteria bacterium RIFCSPLOWO2_01_FULL_45_21 TaxID=1802761 RepID=A0A1G2U1C6_9BACT|nr:MAG: arginine--tRNA ligase [Candidatus Zambryskibacteria bacterium RIFCSPHIGHO2_01_FULL_43_25]OHB03331.1 MAG: arginine--tRNA ligase [Candidatus Zambryskibacteria bacterium RIFCSPLOWO2_01_FULL_45_21]
MVYEKLRDLTEEATRKSGFEAVNFTVEHPANLELGDYASNIALVLGKKNGQNPMDVAEKIAEVLRQVEDNSLSRIEVASPGFINFFLSKEFFSKSLKNILEDKQFGKNENLKGKKVIVEYTDPNPFKEFHIGHLMSNSIGESISRLIEWNGAEAKRACYQGDVGLHVAKAVWGAVKNKESGIKNQEWGKCYTEGAKAYKENDTAKKEIEEINKKIYDRSDEEINKLYNEGRKESLEYFETIYKKLDTKFDFYFFESESGPFGKKIVLENKGGIFEESEGAIIFRGEKYDNSLHTRVFINSDGLPTYEAKELGLAKIKYEKYPYDMSVVITGNEVNEYFRVLLVAMSLVFPELAEKTKHISHGMLRLPSGKMSSRTGEVISAESLILELKNAVKDKFKETRRDSDDKLAEEVAVGALKYSILKQAAGKDVVFDIGKSISLDGDSGPYLQYTKARINSVLEKCRSLGIESSANGGQNFEIERVVYIFPEVVERASTEFSPHYILNYLVEVASRFNAFYAQNTIADKNDPESPHKAAIAQAVGQILESGLHLLAIPSPHNM